MRKFEFRISANLNLLRKQGTKNFILLNFLFFHHSEIEYKGTLIRASFMAPLGISLYVV